MNGINRHIYTTYKIKLPESAAKAGIGVKEFANYVLANKENYSSTQIKRANFAKNAAGWNHAKGGNLFFAGGENDTNGDNPPAQFEYTLKDYSYLFSRDYQLQQQAEQIKRQQDNIRGANISKVKLSKKQKNNISISQINNTKDRKKLSDKYGVTPFQRPYLSFIDYLNHNLNRVVSAGGLNSANIEGRLGALFGDYSNAYSGYGDVNIQIDKDDNLYSLNGPFDLFMADAKPSAFTKVSDYNLFPQYDNTIKENKYGIIPTYLVENAFSTENSKPFDYFSPDNNVTSKYSFYVNEPRYPNTISLKSGSDYIDLYTDKESGRKYYRMRDLYDLSTKGSAGLDKKMEHC